MSKGSGEVEQVKLPVGQPPHCSLTALADVWPRATEMEVGTTLCTIGVGRTLNF